MAGRANKSSLPVSESTGDVCAASHHPKLLPFWVKGKRTEEASVGSTPQTAGAQGEGLCTAGPDGATGGRGCPGPHLPP